MPAKAGIDPEKGLIEYNVEGFLANTLAAEEHMTQIDEGKINDSWCIKKHCLLASGHHLSEMINHAMTDDPELAGEIALFKAQYDEYREKPNLQEGRNLRNRFRKIVKDPTLGAEGCGVCTLDGLQFTEVAAEQETPVEIEQVEAGIAADAALPPRYRPAKRVVTKMRSRRGTSGASQEA